MVTNNIATNNRDKSGLLTVVLYVFSVVFLLAAVLGLIYGFNFQHGVQASTMFIQSALGPIASQIIGLLINGFQTVILAFSGILLIAAILLYCAGRNLASSKKLTGRLAEVESRLLSLEARSGEMLNEAPAKGSYRLQNDKFRPDPSGVAKSAGWG